MSSVFRVLPFVLIATLAASAAPAEAEQRTDQPAGVTADWWSQVQRSIMLKEYAIASGDDGFRAANPAHRIEARFDSGGLRLAPTGEADWEWGLSLRGWGRPGALQTADVLQLSADENRVELDRDSLTEWFVNRPDGLEHGFTIAEPPFEDGERLVLDLALAGELRPVFAANGQAIDFYCGGNVSVLRYAKLVVTDAAGETLPARMEPIAGGIRIAVEDSGALYPITVDPLATSPSWTAVGEAADDHFGSSVATAGDVNGDGYSDVIVGASWNAGFTGKAYLYLGGPDGLAASPSWTATGEAAGHRFGHSVATAGDVDGDGYSDVIIGAYGHTSTTGKVYLYLGGSSGLEASASWTATGETGGDRFGESVATAGDVNGDGYSDVIVGAELYSGNLGKAYLYLGGTAGLSASPSWTAAGEAASSYFGVSVATAGDVNGDGYSDVIVGAYGHDSLTGKAYIYLGRTSGLAASPAWTATGEGTSNFFGLSVATAGDVNGDGYSDVIVGAHANSGYTGRAYLFLGSAGGPSASASWTASGEGGSNYFGHSVATAGDVNGDGYSDVIIGAYYYGSLDGKAYLYQGGAGGLATSASWTATGEAASDCFGYSVATAGDVNGDGYSDVLVGAYGNDSSTGKAYLYLGGADGPEATSSWTATGEATLDAFGVSVATAGDVNGDGYSDVIIGALSYTGKAYLYLGGPAGPSASASWTATGEAASDGFGGSVATAGDVNGDGYSDVLVGAGGFTTNTGKTYLYLGGPGGLATSASWTATGEATNDNFGYPLATAGDVNGDGYSDVLVGAYGNTGNTGKVYLYLGGAGGLTATPSWTATGEAASDEFGGPVATAGDVNGDGYSDVIVGAPAYSSYTGKAYLYLGGPAGPSASASWTATGEAASNSFGGSVATAGDVNGDGYSDIIVGARDNSGYTGKAYLYLGGASGPPAIASWTATGEAALDAFGFSVATAGDVNGDGCSDTIVGAYAYSGYTGKAYLFFGGGGAGGEILPRQLRSDLSAPIHPGAPAYEQQFRLGLTLRSPVGRVARVLQWQVAPWGAFPDIVNSQIQTDTLWMTVPLARTVLVSLSEDHLRYLWRARVKYHPAQSPFVLWSPWVTISGNSLHEADLLSTSEEAPPPCVAPDEETYITTMSLDGNGKPVLHYQDPNQPSDVTGYNIYRATAPEGPWTMIGSNVVDMDEGTPDKQYVDQTGDVGGPYYYEIAAWNESCGMEGPY